MVNTILYEKNINYRLQNRKKSDNTKFICNAIENNIFLYYLYKLVNFKK